MRETDKLFAGSIPELYDGYLGPLIFETYAHDLAARLVALAPRQECSRPRPASASCPRAL